MEPLQQHRPLIRVSTSRRSTQSSTCWWNSVIKAMVAGSVSKAQAVGRLTQDVRPLSFQSERSDNPCCASPNRPAASTDSTARNNPFSRPRLGHGRDQSQRWMPPGWPRLRGLTGKVQPSSAKARFTASRIKVALSFLLCSRCKSSAYGLNETMEEAMSSVSGGRPRRTGRLFLVSSVPSDGIDQEPRPLTDGLKTNPIS